MSVSVKFYCDICFKFICESFNYSIGSYIGSTSECHCIEDNVCCSECFELYLSNLGVTKDGRSI
jgi:hypothetical protein